MNWIPLRVVSAPVMLLLAAMSVIALLRGHNEPGGGFIGGLLAAAGLLIHGLAGGATEARRLLRLRPQTFMGVGVLVAAGSGLPAVLDGRAYLSGLWGGQVVGLGKLGTVLLFDLGVYLVVFGAAAAMLLRLLESADDDAGGEP